MEIVLLARVDFAGSIVKDKVYKPLAQTKTGFIIKSEDNYEIDLYLHFFRVGYEINGETTFLEEFKLTPVEDLETSKLKPKVSEIKKSISFEKKVIEKTEEVEKPIEKTKQPKEVIFNPLINNDDDDF